MLIFRLIGALMLGSCGTFCALHLNKRAAESLSQIKGWISLVRYVRTQIECFSAPVSEILSRCEPDALRACGYARDGIPEGLCSLLEGCEILDGETEKIISDFAGEFGRSYREEQVKRCDYYLSLLDSRRAAIQSQLPSKKKLNATLCIAGALAIVILFL